MRNLPEKQVFLTFLEGILLCQSIMPQLDKFTYFTQFFWSCLFLFTYSSEKLLRSIESAHININLIFLSLIQSLMKDQKKIFKKFCSLPIIHRIPKKEQIIIFIILQILLFLILRKVVNGNFDELVNALAPFLPGGNPGGGSSSLPPAPSSDPNLLVFLNEEEQRSAAKATTTYCRSGTTRARGPL